MPTLHLVPHTHWDREWYRTFEEFRFKLVQLIDSLLEILTHEPDYRYFMLDGQTIVLDDYLEIRPERAETLLRFIQEGRIQIGPWYILPDEFLVSPEATIRNLLTGRQDSLKYGSRMPVGYIPDSFGHIGQMPQILRGFGLESACVWRGVPLAASESWWQAPDGSRVFLCNLRASYSNAQDVLANGVEGFTAKILEKEAALALHTHAPERLLLFGNDHQFPDARTPAALQRFRAEAPEGMELVHSTLPAYITATLTWLANHPLELPVVCGELRNSPTINLLPGVLSARMWIKQRNAACETLLERYAEPLSIWAQLTQSEQAAEALQAQGYLNYAWRLLIQNHPHDSICGCSIDEVHAEMRTRFDKVEQVGRLVTDQTMNAISQRVDTRHTDSDCFASLVVFNPLQYTHTDVIKVSISLPPAVEALEVLAPDGSRCPCTILTQDFQTIARYEVDRTGLMELAPLLQSSNAGYGIMGMGAYHKGDTGYLDVVLEQERPSNPLALADGLLKLQELLADESIVHFSIHAHTPNLAEIQFVAVDVPGFGYATFGLKAIPFSENEPSLSLTLENEFLRVEVDEHNGCLTLTNKQTGQQYSGLHYFSDGGDVGDEYNYSPPENENLLTSRDAFIKTERLDFSDHQELQLRWEMQIPARTTADRKGRTAETLPLEISTRVSLYMGVRRVDFETRVTQHSDDHRLRVHFPVPFSSPSAFYDGHFEVVERPVLPPLMEAVWTEQRRPEVPQRAFSDMNDGKHGLMLAVRGLPEVAVQYQENGNLEAALTLLRCVGWLSRDDFSTRIAHAGPMLATPGAQMHGTHTFSYALIPHTGGWEHAMEEGYAFSAPFLGNVTGMHAGNLPDCSSFLKVEPGAFYITAIKPAADGMGWIVRGCNQSQIPITCWLQFQIPVSEMYLANLAEERQQRLEVSPQRNIVFEAAPHQVVTLRIG